MAFVQLHWFSKVLGKQTTTWVLLPDSGGGPFAAFYLLHGLSDDHTIWLRRTRIESFVSQLPLIVVMPDGGRGFYTDHENGPKYGVHIGEELPDMIEQTFRARTDRAGRFIGGLSMGGYGALRTALAYPDRFESASSHSGAVLAATKPNTSPERLLMFGANGVGSRHDLLHLATECRDRQQLPRLRIDCGTSDFLLEDNRSFHSSLQQLGIDHSYSEYPGGHDWDYWNSHVTEAIDFHLASNTAAGKAV